MSSNEQGTQRAAGLANALIDDPRFEWAGYENIPVDLQFEIPRPDLGENITDLRKAEKKFLIELKEPADYLASALGPSGHLYQQVLTMRELGHPCMILVLGSDEGVTEAIKLATEKRYRGQERQYQIGSYTDRLWDFEAQAGALGCSVMRWKASPWKRLLSLTHKVLTGGNLMSYRPKPANGERELAAASMLLGNGIGPAVLAPVLEHYRLCLAPKSANSVKVCDIRGIGPKRAAIIDQRIYGV